MLTVNLVDVVERGKQAVGSRQQATSNKQQVNVKILMHTLDHAMLTHPSTQALPSPSSLLFM
jgi:hypothetical protein